MNEQKTVFAYFVTRSSVNYSKQSTKHTALPSIFMTTLPIDTSQSAVADKMRCRVGKLWQKYKWKTNCAPNVAGTRKLEALIFLHDIQVKCQQ